MLQRIRDARENDKGFTLIELLIVIVILGVLSAIVVFSVAAFNNEGKLAACKSDRKNVEIASEAHIAKTGGVAANTAALVAANYLKQAPSPDNGYVINLNAAGEAVAAASASNPLSGGDIIACNA